MFHIVISLLLLYISLLSMLNYVWDYTHLVNIYVHEKNYEQKIIKVCWQ